MRKIEFLRGREIDEEKIAKLREIASCGCEKPMYEAFYSLIENIEYLAYLQDVDVEDIVLVLGEDWFLSYNMIDTFVSFSGWVAKDNKEYKLVQTIEMLNVFEDIFLKYRDKTFEVRMRYDTSYQFYSKMLKKRYFKEIGHRLEIDMFNGFSPERVKYIEDDYGSLENFLNSQEAIEHPEYLMHIMYCSIFSVTDKLAYMVKRKNKRKSLNSTKCR